MTTRKIITRSIGIIGIGLLIWGVVLPQFNRKTANESLESLSQNQQPSADNTPENTTSQPNLTTLKSGVFQNLGGQQTKGTVNIIRNETDKLFARLEEDFSVSSGPDLFVGFGNDGRVDESSLLPELKATSGSQNYELPDDFDVARYSQVFIYCKAFAYPFGVANLE